MVFLVPAALLFGFSLILLFGKNSRPSTKHTGTNPSRDSNDEVLALLNFHEDIESELDLEYSIQRICSHFNLQHGAIWYFRKGKSMICAEYSGQTTRLFQMDDEDAERIQGSIGQAEVEHSEGNFQATRVTLNLDCCTVAKQRDVMTFQLRRGNSSLILALQLYRITHSNYQFLRILLQQISRNLHMNENSEFENRHRQLTQGIFNQNSIGVLTMTPEGLIVEGNPQAARLCGLQGPDLRGKNFYPLMSEELADTIRRLHNLGEGVLNVEGRIRQGSSGGWISVTSAIIRDQTFAPQSILVILDDISSRMELDKHRRQMQETLELKVLTRTEELEVALEKLTEGEKALKLAKDEAERANQAKSNFLATISHEIRTPMHAVLGYTQILRQEISNPRHAHYLNIIERAGKNLLLLVNDILDLSKIEAVHMEIQPDFTSIHSIVSEVESIFQMRASEKQLVLTSEISPDTPMLICIDEKRLRQILVNLVGNAVKFTDSGKISIKIWTEELDAPRLTLKISVEDTGIGIAENQLERVFESFRQQEGQNSRKYEGTGLGLAISRKLSELMGGSLTVTSEQGSGSRFVLSLTKVEFREGQPGENAVNDSSRLKGLRVLIVEPDSHNVKLLKEYLASLGAHVTAAESGESALLLLNAGPFDAVFISTELAGMDSGEFAKRIQEQSPNKTPYVFAMSSDPINFSGSDLFDAAISRPMRLRELEDIFQAFLNGIDMKTPASIWSDVTQDLSRGNSEAMEATGRLIGEAARLSSTMTLSDARGFLRDLTEICNARGWKSMSEQAVRIEEAIQEYRIDIVRKYISTIAGGPYGTTENRARS